MFVVDGCILRWELEGVSTIGHEGQMSQVDDEKQDVPGHYIRVTDYGGAPDVKQQRSKGHDGAQQPGMVLDVRRCQEGEAEAQVG